MLEWLRSLEQEFAKIVAAPPAFPSEAKPFEIGRSRQGRPLLGYRFGTGPLAVSLIAGCHADEPVGPRLLRSLARYLSTLAEDHAAQRELQWWIVPDANPDGAVRNEAWQQPDASQYELAAYLQHVVRELPGDDVEFGFPRSEDDTSARSENRAIFEWWQQCDRPFRLHATLHGMAFAAGPWFLIEPAWSSRCSNFQRDLTKAVQAAGYELHDVERHGEKGFHRIARGFCTRPDSQSMRQHFLDRDDPATAERFRPSSMEAMRSLGGDPLTLVSEMPLFVTPGVGKELGPPDPAALAWQQRLAEWRVRCQDPKSHTQVEQEAEQQGLRPMPVADQLQLQWRMITAGLHQVLLESARG